MHIPSSLDGYLKLVYENWTSYTERYHPFHVSPTFMIMHVCSAGSDDIPNDYGTLILTRVPLSSLDSADMAEMETALENIYQTTLEDFYLLRTSDCPNEAEDML